MKADFNSFKKELGRLTDVKYLKKEINRIAGEVKRFDVHDHLTPNSRHRLESLESRFGDLVQTLRQMQKQVDASFVKFVKLVRTNAKITKKAAASAGKKTRSATKAAQKSAQKTTQKTTKKTARKTVRKATRG